MVSQIIKRTQRPHDQAQLHAGARSRLVVFGLVLISAVAVALRVWKPNWALPFVPHPDEPAIMNVVLRMLRNNDPNPHFFFYPSVWIYVQAFVGWLHLHWGIAEGIYINAAQLPETTDVATSVPGFFAWGRVATALAGAATIPALFTLARRLGGPVAGLAAAALLTVNTYHLIHSHYVTTDVPAAFFTALALPLTLQVYERGAWRDYLLVGMVAGLAAGAKHNAALTAVAIVAAHMLRGRQHLFASFPRLVGAGLAMIGCFLLTSPFIVLSFDEFRRDLSYQLGDYAAGAHGDVTGAWPLLAYFDFYREQALGVAGGLLAVWGTAQLLRRRDRRVLVLLALLLAYLIIFMSRGNHWMRNLLPTQVPLFALAGVGAADVLNRLRAFPVPVLRLAGIAALIIFSLLPSTLEAARYTRRLQHDDSRVQAMRWIEQHVPPGVQVAAELKAVPGSGASRWTEVHYLPQYDLQWYRQQGYAYVVASSDTWRQLAIPDDYVRFADKEPIVEFLGAAARLSGPRIVVYSTGLAAHDVPERTAGTAFVGDTQFVGGTIGAPDPEQPHLGVSVKRTFKPGDIVGIRTFWQVHGPFTADYFLFVHVRDAAGTTVAQRDTPPWQGRFPTSTWQPGTLVVDVNDLQLPPTIAPGEYSVVVGMFDPVTSTAPPLSIDGASAGGNAVPLATITVEP